MLTSSVLDLLKKKRLDAILFSSPKQIVYLTSYGGLSQTERDAFLLTTEKRCYVFTNPLVSGEIKEKIKGIIVIENTRSNPFAKNLADVIKKEIG